MKPEYPRFRKMMSKSFMQVNKHMILIIISMFICLSIIGCSCGEGSNTEPTATPYFPVQKNPGFIHMEARIEGRLVLYEGCLRLKPTFGKSYMIIWPYGYKINLEDTTIQVLNADGQIVACVGDWIKLGGGVTDSIEFIEDSIGQPLSPDCTGPYWNTGTIIE